jgi:D-sedoheptulose 7-phosphate isomerase
VGLENSISKQRQAFEAALRETTFLAGQKAVSPTQWFTEVLPHLGRARRDKKGLYFIGNGASCSMSAHMASDFTKNAGIRARCLTEGSLLTTFSNDYSYETAFQEILARYLDRGDLLIGISSSGASKNIVNAAAFARREMGCTVISYTGFKPMNPLTRESDYSVYCPSLEYGHVESAHAHFLHLLIDLFMEYPAGVVD